ncbi:hypothetical protein CG419_09075 [Latilactobacillus curvatus]|uniref:Cupin type-2 domain-containing protein n=1 Tax=Latilactobacillus curvatus TaxID=28038 RepID=A0AAC9UUI3_LATCU|nr:hypothetical protein CG419_09075 [Latilactobacillus curvatus]
MKIFEFEPQNPDRIIPQYWHRSIEILFYVSGNVRVWIMDNEFLLEAGEIIVINSDVAHST